MTGKAGGALARPADRSRSKMADVSDQLKAKAPLLQAMLPKEVTPDRMRALVLTSFQRQPKLMQCSTPSILQCVFEAAKVGLEPDTIGQDCHIIPRKNRGQMEATFQIGFRGAMKLARRASVRQIWSDAVRLHDRFEWTKGMDPKLVHEIPRDDEGAPLSDAERGELICAYACARFPDGFVQFEVVTADDVKRAQQSAFVNNDSPWKTHAAAMWRKTAIKRLCKELPMPDAAQRAIELDDLADAGKDQGLHAAWEATPNETGMTVTDARDSDDDGDVPSEDDWIDPGPPADS